MGKKEKYNMKEHLQSLVIEMVNEIKSLKDLTKETLPEVAKEYIRYNTVTSLVFLFLSVLLAIASIVAIVVGHYTRDVTPDSLILCFGVSGLIVSVLAIFINANNYMSFVLQPRRKAIEAIISLMKDRHDG